MLDVGGEGRAAYCMGLGCDCSTACIIVVRLTKVRMETQTGRKR
jgi:hypothetical protein